MDQFQGSDPNQNSWTQSMSYFIKIQMIIIKKQSAAILTKSGNNVPVRNIHTAETV